MLLTCCIQFANGQIGVMASEEPLALTTRELAGFNRIFHTTPNQQTAAQALDDASTADLKQQEAKQSKISEAYRAIPKDKRTPEAREKFLKELNAADPDTTGARRKLLLDLRALLDQKQDADWPRFERYLRRARWQAHHNGWSCEKTNILGLIEKLNLDAPARATLDDLLDRYDRDLDPLLTNLERQDIEWHEELRVIMDRQREAGIRESPGRTPAGEAHALTRHLIVLLNDNYAQRITPLLPENKRADWHALYEQATLPDAYGLYGRWFDLAIRDTPNMPGLADATRDAIRRSLTDYTAEYDALTTKIAAMQRKLRAAGPDDHVDLPDWDTTRLRRSEASSKAQDRLKQLLTAPQFDRMVQIASDQYQAWEDAMSR